MNFLIALIAGAGSALAFAPFGLWPLMPVAFALLAELVVRAPTRGRALLIGWGFGVGQFCVGLNWIATAFTFQAAMPAWLGWVAVVLLSLYLAVYPALSTGLAWRFGRARPLALLLALAGGWGISEWLRATMFTGFAWNPVGVTLIDTPWRIAAPLVGTYGLSILTVLAGGAAWLAWRRAWRPAAATAAGFALLLTLPKPIVPPPTTLRTFDVATPAPTMPPPAPPRAPPIDRGFNIGRRLSAIRIVQPNIGQQDKWREGYDEVAAQRLASLSRGGASPRLLLWPEAAVTDPLLDQRAAAAGFIAAERARVAANLGPGDLLITGGLGFTSRDRLAVDGATNSVFVIAPGGVVAGRYDKAHLVPYGEYLPMRPILSAIGLSRLAPGDLDFAAGPGPRTIALPGGWGKVGFQLCYEIIFSGAVVDPNNRPDFLFNPSNDAWFGRWGPPQHLAQARLRAVEEGLPIVRSTPTGISALIDPAGTVRDSLPWRTAGVIDGFLPDPLPPTLFARAGNAIPLALAFALLLMAIALDRKRRYRAHI